MPDLRTRLGRYCDIHRYAHEDEYLVCDFCNEHNYRFISMKDITTLDSQSAYIVHAMNVANICLVHLG